MSSKTTVSKIEKKTRRNSNKNRDKSPSVSDIRKIFQAQDSLSKSEKGSKMNSQKGNNPPASGTRAARKASAETKNTENEPTNEINAIVLNKAQDGGKRNPIDHDNCNEHDQEKQHDAMSVQSEDELDKEVAFKETANLIDCNQEIIASTSNEPAQLAPIEESTTCPLNQRQESNFSVTQKSKTIATQTEQDSTLIKMKSDLIELSQKVKSLENTTYDPKNGLEVQLAKNIAKTSDLHTEIFGASHGIKVKIGELESNMNNVQSQIKNLESTSAALAKLLEDSKRLVSDLTIMQGILQKHSQQLSASENKVLDLTKRGMEQNLIIYGVENCESSVEGETQNDKCRRAVMDFLYKEMDLIIAKEDIWKAHRTGRFQDNKTRPMIIKAAYHAKEKIMENLAKLKGKKNRFDQVLFISEQIPEGVIEAKKQATNKANALISKNETKPKEERSIIKIVQDKVLVNGRVDLPEVVTPEPADLFPPQAEQQKIDDMNSKLVETEPILNNNSSFVGLAIKVHSIEEVNRAYKAAVQRFSAMDHVMISYALKEKGVLKYGKCDDREHGGSEAIRKAMLELKPKNTAVFVVRKYGGLHLGTSRFRSIDQAARDAIKLLDDSLT